MKIVIHKKTGVKYAAKLVNKEIAIKQLSLQAIEREIDIMRKLNHPGVIGLHEVIDTPKTLILILE